MGRRLLRAAQAPTWAAFELRRGCKSYAEVMPDGTPPQQQRAPEVAWPPFALPKKP
jgi:hypothetical protein